MRYYFMRSKKRTTFSQVLDGIFTIGGFAVFATVIKVAIDYTQLKAVNSQQEDKITDLKNKIKEIEARLEVFTDFKADTKETLAELTTTLKLLTTSINQQFSNLDKKIDELKRSR